MSTAIFSPNISECHTMDVQDQRLNADDSLRVIETMIASAKSGVTDDSVIYALWGWLVFAAALGQFVLLQLNNANDGAPWLLMPVGGIITFVYFLRQKRRESVQTYIDDFMKYLWIAFGVAMGLCMVFSNTLGREHTFPIVLVIYGIGTFVAGGALRFKPLIVGGIVCWAMAAAAFVTPFETQLLLLAAGVAAGYIVPGHLLRAQVRRANA